MIGPVLAAAGVTTAVGLLIPFAVRPALVRLTVVDVPSARSSHARPTLRGAGAGVAVAVVAGLLTALWLDALSTSVALLLLSTVALTAGLGFVEDVHGIPIVGRLAAQLATGAVVGTWLTVLTGQVLVLPLAVLCVPVLVNVANFMDGVDDLSGSVVIVFGVAHVVLAGLVSDDPSWLVPAGAVVASAGLGFLPWNNGRHKLFLGDSGSYLIGGVMSVLTLGALTAGAPLLAVLGPVAIYLADTSYTLASRVLRGERWLESHRQHRYHLLEDLGWSHVPVALTVAGATTVTSTLGLLSAAGAPPLLCAGGIVAVCALYVASPRVLPGRRRSEEHV